MKLCDKVAIATGASKGIGAAIAKGIAQAGAKGVANYASNHPGAEKTVAAIRAAGGQAVAVKADVSKSSDVQELFEQTIRTFGRLDILVNNAGVYRFEPIEAVTEEEFHRIYNTNVLRAPDDARSNQAFRAGRRHHHQYCHCRDFDDCPDEFGLHIF